MAADADFASCVDEFFVFRGQARKGQLVPAGPDSAPAGALVDDVVRDEMTDLRVVVHLSVFEVVVFCPRAAVGDDERGRVENPRARPELDHIFEERRDGHAVLVAAEAIERMS